MGNLLSLTTFIPLLGAGILALFLRGDDAAAQRNAKWVALATTVFTFAVSLFILAGFKTDAAGSSKIASGSSACATRWASTASRCCS